MTTIRTASVLLACAVLAAAALPASAQQQQRRATRADPEAAMVERLNEESLMRARQGQNSPTPGPDTTQNLNRMSEDAARQGRNMNQAPMPFR
jgi:hypothetical protein